MKRKMTRFALAGKWGGFTANGPAEASNIPASAKLPKPALDTCRSSRRVNV